MSKKEEPVAIFKSAETLKKGDIVKIGDNVQKVEMIGKLFNPGNRLQLLNVTVVSKGKYDDGSVTVFPPSERIEVKDSLGD